MPASCLFCRIAAGEIPATRIAETARCIAIRDVSAQAPVHVLVIPRDHVASLAEVSDTSLLGDLLALTAQVAREEGIESSGYRVVLNTNRDGGQTVFHLHAHVLGGRAMHWPPG